MSSRRLPGKVLKSLAGRPMLAHTLDRLSRCGGAAGILVATSEDPSDDPVVRFLEDHGTPCFRGSLDDVIGRMFAAANSLGVEGIVRISGDSPFIDPKIVDRAIALFAAGDWDLVTNIYPRTYPKGMSVEVLRTAVLDEIADRHLSPEQREHVTKYIYDNPSEFDIVSFTRAKPLDSYSFVVDLPEDFQRAEQLIAAMEAGHGADGLERMIELHDELAS